MENIDTFLASLSDHELAKFTGFRFDEFLGNSKSKIISETEKRKLSKQDLMKLFGTPLETEVSNKNCPQCGSDKLYTETDYEERTKGTYATIEVAIDTNRCRICNYNPMKRKPKNIFDRIGLSFKKKENERVINWGKW